MKEKNHRSTFVLLLVFYEVAIYLSMDAYMPALPEIAHAFGITASLAQFTAIAWMVGGFIVQFIFGPLSDRYGRRPILLYGGVLYIISSLGCALASHIDSMLVFRFAQGVAMPSMYIAGYAAVNELFGTEEAVHKLALMNSITILAPAFGPILGGAFLLVAPWQWIFVILAVVAIITVTGLFFKMPETVSDESKQKNKIHLRSILRQYWCVLSNFRFMNTALITFLPVVGMISWMIAGPFIVTEIFHKKALDYGIMQAFVFAAFIVGTKMIKKFGSLKRYNLLINLGLGLSFLGALSTVLISIYWQHSLVAFVVALMFVTFGTGLCMPILSRLTLEASDVEMGTKVTVFSVVRIGAGVVGSIALAIYYNKTTLSVGEIILVFSFLAVVLRVVELVRNNHSPD